jgi:hypothetical protein
MSEPRRPCGGMPYSLRARVLLALDRRSMTQRQLQLELHVPWHSFVVVLAELAALEFIERDPISDLLPSRGHKPHYWRLHRA